MSRSTEENRYDPDFSRIVELIERNIFSREEINHFLAVLNSKVDHEREKLKSSINAEGDAPLVSWSREIQRTPPQEKQLDADRNMIGTVRRNSDVSLGVGASPIDIARAYMASRTFEGGLDHDNLISKCEKAEPSTEFMQKQFLPSAYSKPSICWPGAMLHDSHGYANATPQSQRGRHSLLDFPRTPYSRTTLRKSNTKLQTEDRYPYTSTPFQPSRTSIYEQAKPRGTNIDGYGSVGPIRRIRNKFASEVRPRGSIFSSTSIDTPSKNVTPKDFGGFLPSAEKNLELGETSGVSKKQSDDNAPSSFERGISTPHVSSSLAVRKILEHLDRNKPTPKEKETELKLATSWRRSSFEPSAAVHSENVNSVDMGEQSSQKNTDTASQSLVEGIEKSEKFNLLPSYHDKPTNAAINGNTKASNSASTAFNILHGETSLPGSAVKIPNQNAFVATTNQGQAQKNFLFSRLQPHVTAATAPTTSDHLPKDNVMKPALPSISVKKPDFRAGFTFPVPASSGVLSEMPTPSFVPPFSSSFLSQPAAAAAAEENPVYKFGDKSSPRLVFSFPSTSSAPVAAIDDSDLKFNFGSEKKTGRLSFSFGENAICY
ncbi:uncharacterized protein LOC127239839 [Andrographis paniculata]|uniref:uncharacterized protein LOC127239839 n=1 Tax=Andrographis paniculata TaxID=175694 RepID=UPI0021E8E0F6|nr:uncharacterized protein LOC127239839 [Andrographis paniculata]